jgi:class 3 adenylate cyclase
MTAARLTRRARVSESSVASDLHDAMDGPQVLPERQTNPGERRHLTVLFSDVSDSTRLSMQLEAEQYAEALGSFRKLCHEVIRRFDGRIARIQGDGMLAVFGFPVAREDDGRRATEAALALHDAVRSISLDPIAENLTLHSGIHAGLVYVSEGDVERGRIDVLGDVPNVAARLSSEARKGEIWVSEQTLGPDAHAFDLRPAQWIEVRGRDRPLQVYQVSARKEPRIRLKSRAVRSLAPVEGRDAEIRLLRESLRAVIGGDSRIVTVLGGPGLGKTRLMEEFLRTDLGASCRVLRGYCDGMLSAQPLLPFLQMLRTSFGITPEMTAADAASLAESGLDSHPTLTESHRQELLNSLALNEAAVGGQRRTAGVGAIASITACFGAMARERPLVLLFDDWQWADDVSRQALDETIASVAPVLVVVATRAAQAVEHLARTHDAIELSPLTEAQTAQTVDALLPGAGPMLVGEIHRYAGGVPLFIEELCHAASLGGMQLPIDRWHGGSAWLNRLIESRLSRLPTRQADLVRAASVIGNVFPSGLLERITGVPASDPAIAALAEHDFVFPSLEPGTMQFKHGIARDVIYDSVGMHLRKALHRQIALALRESPSLSGLEEVYEALAYHYGAGDLPADASHFAELAGDKAMAAYSLDRARTQYSAALAQLDKLAPLTADQQLRWCSIAQKLGMSCVFDPIALVNGFAIFERSIELARATGNEDTIARAEYWLGYFCYARGLSKRAIEHCEASLAIAQRIGEKRLAAQVQATLGQALASACQYTRALDCFNGALDVKRRQAKPGSSVAVGSSYTLACKGAVLADMGEFDEAQRCFDEAIALLGDSKHQVGSSVRNWIGLAYLWQERWEDAIRICTESARIAENVRSTQLLAFARSTVAYAQWKITGDLRTLDEIRKAIAWIESRQDTLVTSMVYGWLVEITAEAGLVDECRRHAARMFLRARRNDRIGEAMGCRALARYYEQHGESRLALRYLDRAKDSASIRSSNHERNANRHLESVLTARLN